MRVLQALNDYLEWLATDAYRIGADGLGAYRIVYVVFLLMYGVPSFVWIGENPDVFYFPPPASLPGQFVDGFPPTPVLTGISAVVAASLLLVLAGWFTRAASLTFSVATVVGLSFAYSFGKIDHNLIVWVVPFLLAWAGWGRRYAVDAASPRSPWLPLLPESLRGLPVAVTALLIAFCMFTAGAQKVWGGWLDPSTHAAYGYVYQAVEVFGRTPPLAPVLLGIESDVLLEAFDYLVVAFEVGFLFAFFHPRALRLFLAGAFAFHLGVYLTMGIQTEILVVVYVLVLVDWDALLGWLRQRLRSHQPEVLIPNSVPQIAAAAGLLIVCGLFVWGQHQFGLPEARYLSLLDLVGALF